MLAISFRKQYEEEKKTIEDLKISVQDLQFLKNKYLISYFSSSIASFWKKKNIFLLNFVKFV